MSTKTKTTAAETEAATLTICSNYPHDVQFEVPDNRGKMIPLVIKGNAEHLKGKPKGVLPVGAYGFTNDVPREAWEWLKANRPDDPLIKNGFIFAASSAKTAADEAAERKDTRNGLEPLDMEKNRNVKEMKNNA